MHAYNTALLRSTLHNQPSSITSSSLAPLSFQVNSSSARNGSCNHTYFFASPVMPAVVDLNDGGVTSLTVFIYKLKFTMTLQLDSLQCPMVGLVKMIHT